MTNRWPNDDEMLPLVEPSEVFAEEKVYTVSELAEAIRYILESNFSLVRVEGEVSEAKIWKESWMFVTLKDDSAKLSAVVMPEIFRRLQAESRLPEPGRSYVFKGRVGYYIPRGEIRLEILDVQPTGRGELYQKYLELKERLYRENLFDEGRKKSLPVYFRTVGIVTSLDGAAIRDILRTLHQGGMGIRTIFIPKERGEGLESFVEGLKSGETYLDVVLYHSLVQGDQAPRELVQALDYLDKLGIVDLVIIGRGGGSIEDLWAFNDETLARRIARMSKPVISAVGHEKDESITDLVADIRCSTPTRAAELLVQARRELIRTLAEANRKMHEGAMRKIQQAHIMARHPRITRVLEGFPRRVSQFRADLARVSLDFEQSFHNALKEREQVLCIVQKRLSPGGLIKVLQGHKEKLKRVELSLWSRVQDRIRERWDTYRIRSHRFDVIVSRVFGILRSRYTEVTVRLRSDLVASKVCSEFDHLENLRHRLLSIIKKMLEEHVRFLNFLNHRLQCSGVQSILDRGFTLTLGPQGYVSSVTQVKAGDELETQVRDGRIISQATRIKTENLGQED